MRPGVLKGVLSRSDDAAKCSAAAEGNPADSEIRSAGSETQPVAGKQHSAVNEERSADGESMSICDGRRAAGSEVRQAKSRRSARQILDRRILVASIVIAAAGYLAGSLNLVIPGAPLLSVAIQGIAFVGIVGVVMAMIGLSIPSPDQNMGVTPSGQGAFDVALAPNSTAAPVSQRTAAAVSGQGEGASVSNGSAGLPDEGRNAVLSDVGRNVAEASAGQVTAEVKTGVSAGADSGSGAEQAAVMTSAEQGAVTQAGKIPATQNAGQDAGTGTPTGGFGDLHEIAIEYMRRKIAEDAARDKANIARVTMRDFGALIDEEFDKLGLTEREHVIARHLLGEDTYDVIGEKLFVSVNTIKFHVRNVLEKAHVNSRRAFRQYIQDRLAEHARGWRQEPARESPLRRQGCSGKTPPGVTAAASGRRSPAK